MVTYLKLPICEPELYTGEDIYSSIVMCEWALLISWCVEWLWYVACTWRHKILIDVPEHSWSRKRSCQWTVEVKYVPRREGGRGGGEEWTRRNCWVIVTRVLILLRKIFQLLTYNLQYLCLADCIKDRKLIANLAPINSFCLEYDGGEPHFVRGAWLKLQEKLRNLFD